jgi:hypothetical protein
MIQRFEISESRLPHTNSYEYQKKGVAKFAFRKVLKRKADARWEFGHSQPCMSDVPLPAIFERYDSKRFRAWGSINDIKRHP